MRATYSIIDMGAAHRDGRHAGSDWWHGVCDDCPPLQTEDERRAEMAAWAETATLDEAIAYSHDLLTRVQDSVRANYELTATCGLFSGGNDSTTFMHLLHERFDFAVHINTGIGITDTRTHVRQCCESWDIPLIEGHPPPGATYSELVERFGFPGPGGHMLMYSRLKERGLRAVRKRFVKKPRQQRVIYVAGMRYFESERRSRNTEETHSDGAIVWCSPFMWWTKAHMDEYRELHAVPRNEVSDHIHMSGECLCGAFAKPGELEMIRFFYPDTADEIEALQQRAKEAQQHCVWGTRPPRKPKGVADEVDRLWICFHGDGEGGIHDDPDPCDDGTWWVRPKKKPVKGEVGLLCAKCES